MLTIIYSILFKSDSACFALKEEKGEFCKKFIVFDFMCVSDESLCVYFLSSEIY